MSDPMTWSAKDAPTADPYEHSVLTVLTEAGDHEDGANCGISYATLAARAKMSNREAFACVQALRERGLIGWGDQSAVAHIRGDRRPVVYDVLIPYDWYSPTQLARVNRWRADRGRPPLSPDQCDPDCERRTKADVGPRCGHRPPIEPPPAKRRRSDLGTRRRPDQAAPHGVTDSPPVHGVTDSPAGLVNSHGVTSKSVDGHLSDLVDGGEVVHGVTGSPTTSLYLKELPPPPPYPPDESADPTATRAGEVEAEEVPSSEEGPDLVDQVLAAAPHWSRATLTEVLAEPDMLDRVRRNPSAFSTAVLAVAVGRYGHTASPRRLLEAGPWWADAWGVPRQSPGPDRPSGLTEAQARARCRDCGGSGWDTAAAKLNQTVRCGHASVYASVAA